MKLKNLTLIALLIIGVFLFTGCENKEITASYDVIPLPQQIVKQDGNPFILSNSTSIVYDANNEDMKRSAQFLSDYITFSTGIKLPIKENTDANTSNTIVLKSNFDHENLEAYQLSISKDLIEINGASEAGAFHGIQTLRKSIDTTPQVAKVVFNPVTITDYPRFEHRGMMLDVARHMFPVEFIKQYIDLLALHNMNRFHWHLTDDQGWRVEIKKYPELAEKGSMRTETVIGKNTGEYDGKSYGGYYTQEEIKDVVAYANDRFITIIPEIDLPGHMLAALTAYPELGCTGGPYQVAREWGIFDDVLCAGNEQTLVFLENVLTEIADLFPSEYIHIGGDECPKVRWQECEKCQAKIEELNIKADSKHTAEQKLQSYITTHVEKFLATKGKKIIGWDEIIEGGLSANATVMSWRGIDGGIIAANQGNDVIMVPTSHFYFDYYQTKYTDTEPFGIGGYVPLEKVYSFNPIPNEIPADKAKHILGVQANLWTEYVPTTSHAEYMVLPRMDALSEVQWTNQDKRDYNSFIERLPRMMNYYKAKEFNYSTRGFDVISDISIDKENGTATAKLTTVDNAPIYYTTDGSTPTSNSNLYTEPLKFDQPTLLKSMVERNNGIETPVIETNIELK